MEQTYEISSGDFHYAGIGAPLTIRETFNAQFGILAFIYTAFYYLFGYFVAWQFSAVREYYAGSTEMLSFFAHMQGQIVEETGLIFFQIIRGFLWAGIAYMAAMNLSKARQLEKAVLVGLAMSIGLAFPLLLPQEFMPAPVRFGHFFELLLENFFFGVIAVYLFLKRDNDTHSLDS